MSGTVRCVPAARTSTAASSATRATATSEAFAAMQFSLVPSTACQRFSPPIAAQPEPGSRLLQALYPTSRKYGHRLRCNRSEEHTSELQSLAYLVCRLLLEKKKKHMRRLKSNKKKRKKKTKKHNK